MSEYDNEHDAYMLSLEEGIADAQAEIEKKDAEIAMLREIVRQFVAWGDGNMDVRWLTIIDAARAVLEVE